MADGRDAVPGQPAGHRAGWYRSPGGVLAHADGPSQVRAFVGAGYTEVDEDTAKVEIGDGLRLAVSRSGARGTFDDESVRRAVREESPRSAAHRQAVEHAKRSAAARKGAATKAAKAAEQQGSTDSED